MAELRWIMTSSLVMLQVLSRTVTSVQTSSFTEGDGDDVTFPCESVIPDQKECNSTTWLFSSGSTATVAVFEYGTFKEGAKVRSDRLNVTEECSLVIKKVKGQDAGTYTCRQYQSGRGKPVGEDVVHLLSVGTSPSATKMTKPPETETPETKTNTSRPRKEKPGNSGSDSRKSPSVKKTTKPPMNKKPETKTTTSSSGDKEPVDPGRDSHKGDDATKTTTKEEGSSATKTTTEYAVTKTPETKTTTSSPGKKEPGNSGPSASKTTKPPVTETPETKTTTSPPGDKNSGIPVLVSVSVGAAALVAITLGLVAWRRTKGNQTTTDDDAADPEGGVAYAFVSFTKNTGGRAQAGLHPDDDEDEGDAVTYTTLKPPRSSAAADPADLYATVNKPAG